MRQKARLTAKRRERRVQVGVRVRASCLATWDRLAGEEGLSRRAWLERALTLMEATDQALSSEAARPLFAELEDRLEPMIRRLMEKSASVRRVRSSG